jgi:hypothetical protein
MKKVLISIFCIVFSTLVFSQDNVILKSGEELKVKITEVSDNNIKYKKLDFLEGPNFTINTSDIFMIKYSNGEKKIFSNTKESSTSNAQYSTIEEGTVVSLYAARTLSSKNMQVGSLVEFRVRSAIVDKDNYVLIKPNEIVYATVNSSSRAKGLGKEGTLSFMIQDIKAVDGQKIPAYLNLGTEGKNRAGTAIAVGALLFWPALFMKGKEAEFKAGTLINASISENRKIKINPELKSTSDNTNYPDIEIEKDCGKKPKNINPFSKKEYLRNTSGYKKFQTALQEWNDCMGIE